MLEHEALIGTMSLEEKAAVCAGLNFWMTVPVEHTGLRSMLLSDGPHGLRNQNPDKADHLGLNESRQAVCHPPACTTACSWDAALLEEMGDCLGRDAASRGVDMLLGPGINIKRSPLCGRNFEYYSEDPLLTGRLASAFVRGVQKNKVAACPKHFAVNSQETRRKSVNAVVDERTLREIYLPAFEECVTKAGAWALMTSYNKVNGEYPAENKHLTEEILRGEWRFDGVLVSDWGAVDRLVESVKAGLTLQMPGVDTSFRDKLIKAVNNGTLREDCLDRAADELLRLASRVQRSGGITVNFEECHSAALRTARESMVLLKNQNGVLPLTPGANIAVIGEMADSPRYQGAGSSHVNAFRVTSPLEEMRKRCPGLRYAKGYTGEEMPEEDLNEALALAADADIAVVFAGLPDSYESETYDRDSINMPDVQNKLIRRLCEANLNTVVVLANGSVVSMPWAENVAGILEGYLGGEAVGEAVASILFGETNPSGKLAETFPVRLEHNPAHLNFPGEKDTVRYQEGVFVGYRYYAAKALPVLYPFGFGLSYTTFDYEALTLDRQEMRDNETLTVRCRIRNTGSRGGKEVVQLYVRNPEGDVIRPVLELRDFTKVYIASGDEAEVVFTLVKRAFSYYNSELGDWVAPTGDYGICIGSSSADIKLEQTVRIICTAHIKQPVTRNTLFKDVLNNPSLYRRFEGIYNEIRPYLPFGLADADLKNDKMARGLLENMTLNSLASYVGKRLDDDALRDLILALNSEI